MVGSDGVNCRQCGQTLGRPAQRSWYSSRGRDMLYAVCWLCYGEACRKFRVRLCGLCRKRHVVGVCRETALGSITRGSALLIVTRVPLLVTRGSLSLRASLMLMHSLAGNTGGADVL